MPKLEVKASRKGYRISDKWAKTRVILKDAGLHPHIPETKRFGRSVLGSMLDRYRMVYVKPTHGSLGQGVMRVEKQEDGGGYSYQLAETRKSFAGLDALYRSIKKDTRGKSYLVQKGVHALKYDGRSYDLRLVVQKAPTGGFEATGTVARVAYPGKVVTNGSQGGTILTAEQVLAPYMSPMHRNRLLKQLDGIGVQAIKRLRRRYPKMLEIGLDIAVDRNLKPWILEVNTSPDHCPFAILSDQTMIRRIIHYGRGYGRTYPLNCNKARTVL